MRLLYLADTRFPLERANGIQTMETCHALARRGHRVRLIVRGIGAERDPFAFYDLPPTDALRIERIAMPSGPAVLQRAAYLAGALAHVRRASADVVLTRDLGVASALVRFKGRRQPPVVYESHGFAPIVSAALPAMLSGAPVPSPRKLARLARRERRVWLGAAGYVTITRALADELAGRFGARTAVAVVPDGARPQARAGPGSPPSGPPLAGYAGHLYPWKGVDTLLEALARAPSFGAVIVGGHPAEPDLARVQALAGRLGVAARVRFTGHVAPAAVADALSEATVLVLPNRGGEVSARYTSPLKLFEYLTLGKPIVASDLPAIREVLHHGRDAWLVAPDDPVAMAEGLETLARDPALEERLASASLELAGAYTWDRRAERLEHLFEEALARHDEPTVRR